jgi:polysaccharide pyruvyl transferase WcaK-like protein
MANQRKRLVYVTGDSYNNSGDIAMVRAFIASLEQKVPGVHVTLIGHDVEKLKAAYPQLVGKGHEAAPSGSLVMTQTEGFGRLGHVAKSLLKRKPLRPSFSRASALVREMGRTGSPPPGMPRPLKEFAERIQTAQALVVGGGGGLNDVFHFVRPTYLAAIAAQAAGVPVFAIGQSVGPFSRALSMELIKELVDFSAYFELREEVGSMEWIRKVGADSSKVLVGADSAMLIPVGDANAAASRLEGFFGKVPDHLMTLNPRFLPESNKALTLERHVQLFAHLVQVMIDRHDLHVLSIPSLYRSSVSGAIEKPHMDRPVSHRIREQLTDPSRMAVLEENLEIEEVKALHAKAKLSIGVGYHPCLFALSAATPCIVLVPDPYYRVKNTGLAVLYEAPELLVSAEDQDWVPRAVETAGVALGNLEVYREKLALRTEELVARADKAVQKVAEALLHGQ